MTTPDIAHYASAHTSCKVWSPFPFESLKARKLGVQLWQDRLGVKIHRYLKLSGEREVSLLNNICASCHGLRWPQGEPTPSNTPSSSFLALHKLCDGIISTAFYPKPINDNGYRTKLAKHTAEPLNSMFVLRIRRLFDKLANKGSFSARADHFDRSSSARWIRGSGFLLGQSFKFRLRCVKWRICKQYVYSARVRRSASEYQSILECCTFQTVQAGQKEQ